MTALPPTTSSTIIVTVRQISTFVAYMLWLFLGQFGIHKFYVGMPVWGVLYLILFAVALALPPVFVVLVLFWLYDLFTLPGQVRNHNARLRDNP